jgi:hypothetical protein
MFLKSSKVSITTKALHCRVLHFIGFFFFFIGYYHFVTLLIHKFINIIYDFIVLKILNWFVKPKIIIIIQIINNMIAAVAAVLLSFLFCTVLHKIELKALGKFIILLHFYYLNKCKNPFIAFCVVPI